MGRPATDKRERLIEAARVHYHRKGIDRTSLTQVAAAANVPAGNSYYYFRSKDALTSAVIAAWETRLADSLATLDARPDPAQRLHAYLDGAAGRSADYTALGCPLNGLSQDLRRRPDRAAGDGSRLYGIQRDWLRRQFGALGLAEQAGDDAARSFLSSIQGSLLLAHTTDDPDYIVRTVAALKTRLDALAADAR